MKIAWTVEAHEELLEILASAEERNMLEASNILDRIARSEQVIVSFPKAALYNAEHDFYEKYVPRTRVILIYRLTGDEIVMISAFHTSRDTGSKPE